jgi:hypothetical protein
MKPTGSAKMNQWFEVKWSVACMLKKRSTALPLEGILEADRTREAYQRELVMGICFVVVCEPLNLIGSCIVLP